MEQVFGIANIVTVPNAVSVAKPSATLCSFLMDSQFFSFTCFFVVNYLCWAWVLALNIDGQIIELFSLWLEIEVCVYFDLIALIVLASGWACYLLILYFLALSLPHSMKGNVMTKCCYFLYICIIKQLRCIEMLLRVAQNFSENPNHQSTVAPGVHCMVMGCCIY